MENHIETARALQVERLRRESLKEWPPIENVKSTYRVTFTRPQDFWYHTSPPRKKEM